MIGSFTEVKPLYYWVQHILPLVYDDSLSYMELLGKVTKILNELVENNNLLPDYIMQLIKEYISSGEIEKVLSEVLANYMLNVKFPPKGLTPAVGDGSADDTEAIQGCIDYAYQNGGMAVYFPSGAYLTQPLTLNEKVTLFGQDRYTARIVMKGGATKPLFTGTVDEMSLTGLGFDGNMDIQVNNVNLFTITVNSAIITNCLLTDGYDLLNITVNNELQLDNILFRHAVENALVVGGAGYVQGDNLIFKSLSTLIGKNYIVLNTNKSILEEVKCFGAAPNGVLIGGNSNVVNMWCEACQTPYVDNGTDNTIHVYGASEDEKFTGDVTQYIGGFLNQTVVATKKLTARNVIDTAGGTRQESTTGDKTETVNGNDTETVGGDKKETVSGSKSVMVTRSLDENIETNKISAVKGTNTETITGLSTENANGGKVLVSTDYNENVINKTITAAKIEETLTGNKTVTAANITENISGDKTVNAGDVTETSKNRTMVIEENYTLSAKGIEVNSIDIGSIINYNYKHYLIAIEPDLTSVFNNVTDSTLILLSPDIVYTVGTCTINSSNVCIMGASNVKKAVIKLTGNISVLGTESGVFKDGFSIINVELNGNNRAFDFIIKFRNRTVISSCNFINFNHCLHIEQSNIISIDRSLFRYSNYGLYAPKSAVGESYSNEILVVDSSFNDNYNTCCFAYGGGAGTKHTFRNCTFEIAQGESDIYKFDYENVTLVLDGAYIEDNYYTVRTNGIYVHNGATLWFVNSNVNNILQVIKCTDSYAHVYNNKIINCTRVAEITNGGPYTFHSNGNYFYGMEVPYLNHSDFNNIIGSSYLPNIGTNIPIYKTTIGESKQQIFTYPYLGNGYISLVIGANKQAVCPIIPVPGSPNSLSIDMSVFEVGDVVYIYLIEIKLNHVILGEKSPFVF